MVKQVLSVVGVHCASVFSTASSNLFGRKCARITTEDIHVCKLYVKGRDDALASRKCKLFGVYDGMRVCDAGFFNTACRCCNVNIIHAHSAANVFKVKRTVPL